MASFTDMIPTFNPYIQQLPVEEMSAVGMEKQKRYDEGIQKIQSQIDNIAGLDIVRNVDRKYLQSRLNRLGNELRTVAAGDFSNFQLVNSTGGMINQVSKDRNIINAVRSTAKYRKAIENRDKLIQEGKGSPSNDWLFGKEVNDWINSEDLNAQFNSDYRPYVDWKKNAREVLKSINPSAKIEDHAFGPDGKLTDAVIREQFKGVKPEQIQTALMAGLTAADFQQMQIDGRYQYANYAPEEFAQEVNRSYTEKFDDISKKRSQIIGLMKSTNNVQEKEMLQSQLDSMDSHLDNVQKEYNNIAQTFQSGDAESAKARLFTTNFMTNFSNAFSYSEVSSTYEKSHLADMDMRRTQFNLTIDQRERHFWARQDLDERRLALDYRKFEAEFGYDDNPLATGLDRDPITKEKFLEMKKGKEMQANEIKTEILASTGFNEDQLLIYRKHLNGDELTADENLALSEMTNTLLALQDKFSNNELHANTRQGQMLAALHSLNDDIDRDNILYERIEKEADANPDLNPQMILRDFDDVTYKPVSGNTQTYTPEELIDGRARAYQFIKSSRDPLSETTSYRFLDREAVANLNDKELAIYEVLKKKHSGERLSPSESNMYKAVEDYTNQTRVKITKVRNDREEYVNSRYNEVLQGYQPLDNAINLPTSAAKNAFGNKLLTYVNLAEEQGALPEGTNTKAETLRDIASNISGAIVTTAPGNDYQEPMLRITVMGGKEKTTRASWDITQENYNRMFGGRFDRTPAQRSFDKISNAIQRNFKSSNRTAPLTTAKDGSGTTTPDNAFLHSQIDFPQIKLHSVKANVIESKVTPGLYSIEGVILNPETGRYTGSIDLYGELLNQDQVIMFMNTINDSWVSEKLEDDLEKLRNKK